MEVHVRVPLEKEVPLTSVIEEPKPLDEKPEFPELTEVWTLYLNVHAVFTICTIYMTPPNRLALTYTCNFLLFIVKSD